ncbi:MAG: glycosyl transferase group 1 [Frankiales bacterium]|nr:glycosyl transferase group 1 [Frankiales bacterium]
MKLAFLVEQLLAPVPGGTGRYTAELAGALLRTAGPEHSVVLYSAWHRDGATVNLPGTPASEQLAVRRFPLPRRGLVAAWERGLPPVPRHVDVTHAPTPLAPTAPAVRRRLVVTIHDVVPWRQPETLTPRGARWHRAMTERLVRAGAQVVVPSASVAAELLDCVPGLRSGRLAVLGAGATSALAVEPDRELAARVAARLDLPDRYLLCVATLEPRKGLDVLLDALVRLGPAAPALLLVGQQGWGGLDLAAEIASRGLPAGRVRSLGRIEDAQLAVVYRRAFALVMPSLAEGFGLPVLEAMSLGIPVICTDVPALVELTDGAAVLVPRGDSTTLAAAIADLFSAEPAEIAQLVVAGLGRAAKYSWDEVAGRAWQLYERIA